MYSDRNPRKRDLSDRSDSDNDTGDEVEASERDESLSQVEQPHVVARKRKFRKHIDFYEYIAFQFRTAKMEGKLMTSAEPDRQTSADLRDWAGSLVSQGRVILGQPMVLLKSFLSADTIPHANNKVGFASECFNGMLNSYSKLCKYIVDKSVTSRRISKFIQRQERLDKDISWRSYKLVLSTLDGKYENIQEDVHADNLRIGLSKVLRIFQKVRRKLQSFYSELCAVFLLTCVMDSTGEFICKALLTAESGWLDILDHLMASASPHSENHGFLPRDVLTLCFQCCLANDFAEKLHQIAHQMMSEKQAVWAGYITGRTRCVGFKANDLRNVLLVHSQKSGISRTRQAVLEGLYAVILDTFALSFLQYSQYYTAEVEDTHVISSPDLASVAQKLFVQGCPDENIFLYRRNMMHPLNAFILYGAFLPAVGVTTLEGGSKTGGDREEDTVNLKTLISIANNCLERYSKSSNRTHLLCGVNGTEVVYGREDCVAMTTLVATLEPSLGVAAAYSFNELCRDARKCSERSSSLSELELTKQLSTIKHWSYAKWRRLLNTFTEAFENFGEEDDNGVTSRAHLFVLPNDILHTIISFLSYRRVTQLGGVCVLLKEITDQDDIWARLYLRQFEDMFMTTVTTASCSDCPLCPSCFSARSVVSGRSYMCWAHELSHKHCWKLLFKARLQATNDLWLLRAKRSVSKSRRTAVEEAKISRLVSVLETVSRYPRADGIPIDRSASLKTWRAFPTTHCNTSEPGTCIRTSNDSDRYSISTSLVTIACPFICPALGCNCIISNAKCAVDHFASHTKYYI
jgi:hypothetical protein